MIDKPEFQEQLGPQARLEAELFKLESQRRELWVLIIFTVVVMVLGGLSLLLPGSIWHGNELEIKIPPQVLFVIMTVFLVLAVYMMRRGVELQKYRLAQMAAILKTCVRGSDYVVRYGGDEFLLVLPETDQAGAEVVRERIQQRVGEWNGESRLDNLQVTVSIGLYLHVAGQSPDQ